jgi:hypothetical protein
MQVIITVNLPVGFTYGKNEDNKCYRKVIIEDSIISYQVNRSVEDMPSWVNSPKIWRKMTPQEKLKAYAQTFDEGWGVSYECVE